VVNISGVQTLLLLCGSLGGLKRRTSCCPDSDVGLAYGNNTDLCVSLSLIDGVGVQLPALFSYFILSYSFLCLDKKLGTS